MKLDSIKFYGEKLKFNREFGAVFIELPENLIIGQKYKISVFNTEFLEMLQTHLGMEVLFGVKIKTDIMSE